MAPIRLFFAKVAPYMGAWIEIRLIGKILANERKSVAPYMGAWIEIAALKSGFETEKCVAPYMGAWIEIIYDR
jgi:lipocalin